MKQTRRIPRLCLAKITGAGDHGHVARPLHTRRRPAEPHTHDFAELFWVNEGAGWHTLDGRREALRTGDVRCIRPEDTHALEVAGGGVLGITNVAFPAEALEWLRARYFAGRDVWPWAEGAARPAPRVDAVRLQALDAAADRLAAAPRERLHFERFLLEVLVVVDAPEGDSGETGAPDWLRSACRALREPDALREGVPALVRASGRSPEHVARVMRASLGWTPTEHVNRLRVDQACFQLRMTARPVTEIAYDVGYENLSHFFHVFKKLRGASPRAFRERQAVPIPRR